jgi:hypothetical protein
MLPTIAATTYVFKYTVNQTLVLSGSELGVLNTKYTSDGANTLELPDANDTPAGAVIVVEQDTGECTIEDNSSSYYEYETAVYPILDSVPAGVTKKFVLVNTYGRKSWTIFEETSAGGGAPVDLSPYALIVNTVPKLAVPSNPPSGPYTLVAADLTKHVTIDDTLTIPLTLAVGFQCSVYLNNVAAKALTTTGYTIQGLDADAKISGKGTIGILVTAANTLLLSGHMEA